MKKKTRIWKLNKWWKKTIYIIGILAIIWWIIGVPFGIITAWGAAFTKQIQEQTPPNCELLWKDYQIECERVISNLTLEYNNLYSEYEKLHITCNERINSCNKLLTNC